MRFASRRWLLVGWILLLALSACVGWGPRPAPDSPATVEVGATAAHGTPTWSPLAPLAPTPSLPPSPTPSLSPSPTSPPRPSLTPSRPLSPPASLRPSPTSSPTVRFAVIGDFGQAGPHEQAVAALVASWHPDFIVTTGDNNYPNGARSTMAANVLQYYGDYVKQRRFFPALGNHDWRSGIQPHLDTFDLPGNERYYDVAWGPVHLFILDSDWHEPHGITAKSKQAQWLRQKLAGATEPWKLVVLHHPPYSSGPHGSYANRQWPFAAWGATAVLSGHDHTYERILRDGIVYFVNGLGGASIYKFENPVPGSAVRYNANYGAMLVKADANHITFQFINIQGKVIDTYTLRAP